MSDGPAEAVIPVGSDDTVVLLAVFGTGSVLYPNFGTPRVFVNLLNDNAFVGVAP